MAISYANIQVTKVLTLRGNTIQNNRYTGLPGELTVDTEAKTIRIHDGVTPGGNTVQGGGGASSYANANVKVYLTQFDGNIVPSANVTYTLGNITHQWRDLFVSNNTIYVGGVPLGIDATGNLTVNGNIIPTIAYVNASVANVTVDLSAYALNANVTAANVGLKGYVDQANTIQSSQLTSANLGIIGYIDLANTIQSAQISAANIGIIGYIDQANTIQSAQVNAANLAITAANLGLKGYVDQANTIQSAQVGAANLAIAAANVGMKGYVDSVASQSIYGNANVAAYLPTFSGNISAGNVSASGNVTADYFIGPLGSITNLDSLNFSVENISARIAENGVNIGAGGYNNLVVLPTEVMIQNVPLTVAGNIVANETNGLSITANLPMGGTAQIWNFGTDGRLTFPGTPRIATDSANFEVQAAESINFEANAVVSIYTDTSGNLYQWIFGSDGDLTLPGATAGETIATSGGYITVGNLLIGQGGSLFNSNNDSWALYGNISDPGATIFIPSNADADNGLALYIESQQSNVEIRSGSGTWNFDTDGNLTLPNVASVSINYANGVSILSGLGGGGGSYSNVNVAAYLATATINTTGNITAGNLFTSGALYVANITTTGASGNISGANYITANYFVGNGALLTGLSSSYSNVQVATYLPTYDGVVTASNVAVNGNVTAQYFLGNGALLTGIVAGAGNYSNVDVKAFLETDAGPGDGFQRVIEGYYSNIILGDSTKLFSFGNSSKSYFGHDGFLGNASINYIRADNADVRIATNNGAYAWIFDRNGNLTFPSNNLVIKSKDDTLGNAAVISSGNFVVILSNGASGGTTSLWAEDYANIGTSNIAAVYANPTVGSKIVRIAVGQNGGPYGPNLWDFGNTGTTRFPNSTILAPAGQNITMQSDQYSQLMWENANLTVAPDMAVMSNFYVAQNSATLDIVYRDGSSNQQQKSWFWSLDGNLKLPSGGYILNSDDSIYGGGDYSNVQVAAYLSTATINTTGNITAQNLIGNISITGNVTGTSANVTLQAGAFTSVFDNQGNVRLPIAYVSGNVTANYFIGNGALLTGIAASSNYSNVQVATYLPTYTGNIANIRLGVAGVLTFADGTQQTTAAFGGGGNYGNANVAAFLPTYTGTTGITQVGTLATLSVTGNTTVGNLVGTEANTRIIANTYVTTFDIYGNVTFPGNVSATNFVGSGSLLSGVAIKTTGSWTVPTGNSTQSFTVPTSGTYQLWVDCNIPNGILAWNATATVTNSNVPVVGAQYAWVYNGGGTPIDFTSIPNQFVGTGNTIVRSSVSPSVTTNRFDFGINNTSGGNVTVSYGYVKIS